MFFITKSQFQRKLSILERQKRLKPLQFCFWLVFMSLLLEYYCVLQRAAKMEWIFQSFNKGPEMFTVPMFCILQADFKLMCDNAMTYNRPDTVYYKLAKKILHTGFKMMSKVRDLLKTKSRNFWGFLCYHT